LSCIDGDDDRYFKYNGNGIEIPGIQSRIRIEYFLMNNEQWAKQLDENKS
jgi:hypothetical protein